MSTDPTPSLDTQQQDRKRKRKAILAGGLVLGLGAAVTLAAWSDDVFADGTFQTGTFELEGNVGTEQSNAAGTWAKMDATLDAPAGALAFAQTPQTLVPNQEVRAPLALRLSNATTVNAAAVTLTSLKITSGPTTLNNNLKYNIYVDVAASSCTASEAPGSATITGTISDPDGSTTSIGTLDAPTSTTANDQTVIPLCLGVTLTSNEETVQGVGPTTVTWQFTGKTA